MRPKPQTFEQAIGELNAAVTEAFNRGDVKTCAESYAENATLLLADHPPIKGRDAIESFLRDYATSGAKLAPVGPLEVKSSGEMGCCAGTYEFVVPSKTSSQTKKRGKFVTVFMRQSNGSWKVIIDSLISD